MSGSLTPPAQDNDQTRQSPSPAPAPPAQRASAPTSLTSVGNRSLSESEGTSIKSILINGKIESYVMTYIC